MTRLVYQPFRLLATLLLLCWVGSVWAQTTQHLYFNAQGTLSVPDQAVYRRDYVLADATARVQDFYHPSGKAYSDVYWISPSRLNVFTPILHHGQLVLWYENGAKKMQGSFRQERPDGLWLTWHDNGQLAASLQYRLGQVEGVGSRWYANGQKESQMPFRHGQANGRWQQWYPSGHLKAEMSMVNDRVSTVTRWNEQGRLTADLAMSDAGASGVLLSWYADGAKRSETVLHNNEAIKTTRWDEAGQEVDE